MGALFVCGAQMDDEPEGMIIFHYGESVSFSTTMDEDQIRDVITALQYYLDEADHAPEYMN